MSKPCSCGAGAHGNVTCDIAVRNAIADARAAGFAEAIKMAAKIAYAAAHEAKGWDNAAAIESVADAIRALAPAKLEEPK